MAVGGRKRRERVSSGRLWDGSRHSARGRCVAEARSHAQLAPFLSGPESLASTFLPTPSPAMSSALPQHSEKASTGAGQPAARRSISRLLLRVCCGALLLVLLVHSASPLLRLERGAEAHAAVPFSTSTCPQPAPWADVTPLPPAPPPLALARLLSRAVRINTSVYDGTPPVSSAPELWNATFAPFASYLRSAFPLLHTSSAVRLERVNTHGLLYTYEGSEKELKPVLFTAHQDVVPVDASSEKRWTHDPFSGLIDEKLGLVWGRGASDDKGEPARLPPAHG